VGRHGGGFERFHHGCRSPVCFDYKRFLVIGYWILVRVQESVGDGVRGILFG
jgi:hypothetical protein